MLLKRLVILPCNISMAETDEIVPCWIINSLLQLVINRSTVIGEIISPQLWFILSFYSCHIKTWIYKERYILTSLRELTLYTGSNHFKCSREWAWTTLTVLLVPGEQPYQPAPDHTARGGGTVSWSTLPATLSLSGFLVLSVPVVEDIYYSSEHITFIS